MLMMHPLQQRADVIVIVAVCVVSLLQAFSNILGRMLEAHGRGMWTVNPDLLARLKKLYGDMDDQLEGVTK